jgi:hypothetical protein
MLGTIGIAARNEYKPGLGTFLAAATAVGGTSDEDRLVPFSSPGSNPLDAMSAWSRKADAAHGEALGFQERLVTFLWNLQPLPSELVPLKPLGRDLTEVMGIVGGLTGLPTPCLAELYYAFNHWGALLGILFGAACARFDTLAIIRPGVTSSICLVLCLASIPVSLHSPTRAVTRFMLYACLLYLATSVNSWVVRRKTFLLHPTRGESALASRHRYSPSAQ